MRTSIFALVVIVAARVAGATAADELVLVDGTRQAARLVAVDGAWNVEVAGEGTTRSLKAADIVSWGMPHELADAALVRLVDGGILAARIVGADRETLAVDSPLFGELKLPLEIVAGVLLAPPLTAVERDRLLDRLAARGGDTDRLLLDNGDELAGAVRAIRPDAMQSGAIELEAKVGAVSIELPRVVAVIFNPALSANPAAGPRALVGFRDGSLIVATVVSLPEGSQKQPRVRASLAGGPALETDAADLVFFQPLGGQATYVSDLTPQSYRHIPFLSLSWPYALDRSVAGGRLTSGGRLYPKGIGMHSASRLTFALAPEHQRFDAQIGIDDASQGRGSVVFRVFVDNAQKYASPVIRAGDAVLPISVDVRGGKRLSLIVDFADHGDELDRADWLDARLVK